MNQMTQRCAKCGQEWWDAHVCSARVTAVPNVRRWPIKGVRVDGDKVIVAVNGGNEAARWLCGEILAMLAAARERKT